MTAFGSTAREVVRAGVKSDPSVVAHTRTSRWAIPLSEAVMRSSRQIDHIAYGSYMLRMV